MTWRRDRGGGFTLIEILIVLAIIGLALGLAMPLLMRREPVATSTAAANELIAALRLARSAAIGEDRIVMFGGGTGGYAIDGRFRRLAASPAARVDIAGGTALTFFPSGGSSGGNVVLRGGVARREIAVDAVTGHAAIVP